MKTKFESMIVRRIIAILLSIMLVLGLIPASSLTVLAATAEHPSAVTITVKDENGEAVSGASVQFVIDSASNGDNYKSGTKSTDASGSVEVLMSDEYVDDDYTITYTVAKSGYTSDSATSVDISSSVQNFIATIKATSITGITITPAVVEYDGSDKNAVSVAGTKNGDTVSYKLDEGDWTASVPTIKELGTYTVTVKVEREGYDDYISDPVTAEVKKGVFSVNVTPLDKEYDEKASEVVEVSGTKAGDTITYELDGGDAVTSVPSVTNVGEYSVKVTVHRNDNYNDFVKTYTAKVKSIDINGLSATLYSGTYDEKEHDAVISVKGNKAGDKIEYKLDSGEWSEDVPKVKNAGTYTVSIRVSRTNFNTTTVVDLNPATVVINKKAQDIAFSKKNAETVVFDDNDASKNVYDFSAIGGNTDSPVIEYKVENDTDGDSTDITEIAEINEEGKFTVKAGGYNLLITATVKGDSANYEDTSITAGLTVQYANVSDLVSFDAGNQTYTMGTSTTVASQKANKSHKDDNGAITYSASFKNDISVSLADAGLSIDKNSGKLSVVDYGKLAAVLESNLNLRVEITADKAAGTKRSGFFGRNKVAYPAASVSYLISIKYGSTPAETYLMQDPEGTTLSEANGNNGWYKTAITVVPVDSDKYMIAKDSPVNFASSVEFNNQGECVRVIYLKDKDTGAICSPITVSEIEKIDSVKPDSNKISIEFSEPVLKKILWFYNPSVTVTITGYDETSGIDHFNWSYTRASDASASNLEKTSGEVKASPVEDEAGKYTASFTLPGNQAEQLRGSILVNATDNAGLVSDNKQDDGRVLVVDTISPTSSVVFALENNGGTQQEVNDHYYYSDNVKFTFDITEANFFGEDVSIKVSKNGNTAQSQKVTWSATGVLDQHEATLVLSGDGDYVVSMTYKDRSNNEMVEYVSDLVTIDTINPTLSFNYSNGNNKTAEANDEQKATIIITEHNFRASDISVDTTAVDINGSKVSVEDFEAYLKDETSWEKDGDKYTSIISEDFADAIYTMTFNYKDLALRTADEVKSGEFIVDRTAPSIADMSVSYSTPLTQSIISGLTFGFYNPDVTITFIAKDSISGVDYFTWSYVRQEGASETNVDKYVNSNVAAVQDTTDKSKFTASVTLPKEAADQLRGNIAFSATDKYSNASNKKTETGHIIVVDTITPTLSAEYTESSRTVGNKMYYNKDFTATFTVTEANFFKEDVKVEVSKDGGTFAEVSPKWTDKSTDVHVGTYTIEAPSSHKGDGDYIFRVSYTDRSNNRMATYTSDTVVIDTIKPVIDVSYANNNPKNTLKDSERKNRKYFDGTQTATVTVTEHNFASDEVIFSIVAKDVSGNKLNVENLNSKSKWNKNGDKHSITITYPGDANYTFDVEYTDLATNKADDYAEDYFTVDKTAPTGLSITYSKSVLDTVLSGISFGFYQAPVTVTISANDNISGVHSFLYSYLKAAGVSGVNAELVNQMIEEGSIKFSNGGATGTATFTIPRGALGNNNQFNGTVKFTANDRADNKSSEFADSKRIVVDNIAPTSSVEYNAPVNTSNGISYYDGTINVTVTIHEANFYSEDVNVSVTKDGAAYGVSPTWSNSSTDVHVGTFALTDDGDYFITISYTDKSNNQMVTYTSEQMTVDTEIIEPVITVNGEDGNGKAYKDEVLPAVSFEDINFENYEIKLTRTRYDKKDEDVTEQFIGNNVSVNDQGGTGTFDTFVKEPDVDGIYTLLVSITDKAGHSAETSSTFTVNRFGSVYVYDDYLISLIKDGGAYVQSLDNDLVITEYNADKLVKGSLNVEVSCDGKPLTDVDFDVTPEVNDQVSVGNSGWYQYQYTIDKANFANDGTYRMAISSKDATGNSPETTNYEDKEVLFRVDSTVPEINSITGLEESIINAQSVTVKYSVYDTIALESVKIYVNDKVIDEVTEFSTDMNNYEGNFELSENSAVQSVKLVVTDRAGNITDTSSEEFKEICAFTYNDSVTVSTSIFVRAMAWAKQHVAVVVGVIVAIAAVISYFLFFFKRRKITRNKKI